MRESPIWISLTLTTNRQNADALLNFFTSVFTREPDDVLPGFDKLTKEIIDDLFITEDKVVKKLKKLKRTRT